jgi:hypothetical protein
MDSNLKSFLFYLRSSYPSAVTRFGVVSERIKDFLTADERRLTPINADYF